LVEVFSAKRNRVWFSAAVNSKGKLVACAFSDRNRREAEKALGDSLRRSSNPPLRRRRADRRCLRLLNNFYIGKGARNSLQAVDLSSVSYFREDVYGVLCRIPLGKVTTYGAIARKVGGKRYARAVGTAVATNPLPLIVPCHRVVSSSLKVGNYGICGRKPSTGGYMKRMLLEREGVKFEGERVSKKSTWTPK